MTTGNKDREHLPKERGQVGQHPKARLGPLQKRRPRLTGRRGCNRKGSCGGLQRGMDVVRAKRTPSGSTYPLPPSPCSRLPAGGRALGAVSSGPGLERAARSGFPLAFQPQLREPRGGAGASSEGFLSG